MPQWKLTTTLQWWPVPVVFPLGSFFCFFVCSPHVQGCRTAVLLPADSYAETSCPRKATTCKILHMHTFRNGLGLSPALDFWGSSGLPLGHTESLLRHLIVPLSLAVAFPTKKKELLSAVSADWINTNRHGFGITLILFSLQEDKLF